RCLRVSWALRMCIRDKYYPSFTSIHVRLNLFHQFRVITSNNAYICFIPFHIDPFRAVRCVYLI
ncbi:hypothetical protein B1L95_25415, partial [Salmonella enterica subsp. enterica serovar Dublin]|uniref:hypothetical protein n=1 Tax=Salmonella enterica TaxID=28901 RepID=UPI000D3DD3C0